MNNIDTIYMNGDLLVEKLSNHNDDTLFIIKQVTESNGDTVKAITWIICGTIVSIALFWLILKIIHQWMKYNDAKYERRFKERDRLIKIKQEYQSRLLDDYQSCKKIYEIIEKSKKEQSGDSKGLEELLQKIIQDCEKYTEQSGQFRNELDNRIIILNERLGIESINHDSAFNQD